MKYSPWVHTTDRCNMSCPYCYVKGDAVMGKEVYRQISKIFPHYGTHIRIAGGEPLLAYDNWKDWIYQWERVEVLTNFRHIPNGYFDLPVRTSVSIDGSGEKILDKEIVNNLKRLYTQPWIMTVANDLSSLPLLAYFVADNKYGWSIEADYFWTGTPTKDDFLTVMAEVIAILKSKDYNFENFNFCNLDFANRGGCCAGKQMVAIYCDGTVYPCQTLMYKLEHKIGSVWIGWDITECGVGRAHCKGCSIEKTCTGWCPLYHRPNELCDVFKFIVWEVLYAK